MPTNVTQKDKTLQEVIDWCTDWSKQICDTCEGDFSVDYIQLVTLKEVIDHCKHMLVHSGSMPVEGENDGNQCD